MTFSLMSYLKNMFVKLLGGFVWLIMPTLQTRPQKLLKNYALQGLNFDKFGQFEYGLAKIKVKTFFLHSYLFCLV